MVALQIRDVPEAVRDRLADMAAERGQSLQTYLFDLINDEVRRRDNLAVLEQFSAKRYGTRLAADDVVGALERGRTERDRTLGSPLEGTE